MPSITNHKVLILGGTSGIGFAVAALALAQHCTVVIASSSSARVDSALARLRAQFSSQTAQISGHVIDLLTPSNLPSLEKNLTDLFHTVTSGKSEGQLLDHVIVTAGKAPMVGKFEDTDVAETMKETGVMFAVPLAIGKIAPAYMNAGGVKEGRGKASSSITFTGGRLGDKPIPGYVIHCAYARGLQGMVMALGLQLGKRGVRVNEVSPGATATEMWGDENVRKMIAEKVGETALLGKVGSAEEVAEAYIYLMRDWNATGTMVNSEGGAFLQ